MLTYSPYRHLLEAHYYIVREVPQYWQYNYMMNGHVDCVLGQLIISQYATSYQLYCAVYFVMRIDTGYGTDQTCS